MAICAHFPIKKNIVVKLLMWPEITTKLVKKKVKQVFELYMIMVIS